MWKEVMCAVAVVFLLGLAGSASAEIPRDPNLVIYYSYDTVGAIVPDESGKGHNGAVCGDVSGVASGIKWYGAAEFLGEWGPTKYSYLDLDSPHYAATDIPRSAITLAAWVKCRKTGKDHAIMSIRAADNTWIMHPQINDNGSFRWLLRSYGGTTIYNIVAGTHGWDEWVHYAGTYDKKAGLMTLYIDGAVVQQQSIPNAPSIAGDWGTGARIGYNIDNARPFTGVMDEFYLFTRALSLAEINALLDAEGLLSEKASHPKPGDGTELTATSTTLQWLPGAFAATNKVYFGQNFDDVNNGAGDTFKGEQAGAEFAVSGLSWGTTYYWRIDGVNTVNTESPWKGDVWSFLLRPSTAWNPTPADGARWIDPNADLTWSPGRGATVHYVYFGDNLDAVSNATGASPQTTTTFDPGPLGFEKVYYWRVDEFDTSGATHKGSVWTFTTRRADSGLRGEYFKDTGFKTLVLTRTDPGINFNWGAESPDAKVPVDNFAVRWTGEFEVPFTSSWTFTSSCDDCVRLWVNGRLLFDKFGQQGGMEWTGTIDLAAGQKYSIVVEYYENSGDARAILYWSTPYWLTPYQPKQAIPQGAYSLPRRARSPDPGSEAVDVRQTSILRWTAGEKATFHDVYFGEDANAVADANATTKDVYRGQQALDATTFSPGQLAWNKTYYWRIDEVNAASPESPWKGAVWSFTTADFLVVDDFESYTDDFENLQRVFQVWIDGGGYTQPDPGKAGNGSGALIGTSDAPWVELTVVHGGRQAMPMSYDNRNKPYYSEAQRTWTAPQDWTVNGVATLVLYVQGRTDNGPDPLYVVLEDNLGNTGTVTHSDAAAVTLGTWLEWKIPLSSFSKVTAAKIKKMSIGVGRPGGNTPGNAGTIYVDDIRVVKP